MSVRVPSMSVLPPVRRGRVIAQLPQCYSKKAAVQTKDEFNFKVKTACQEQRTGTVGFKIAKVIVVGDLAVGKTCLINRMHLTRTTRRPLVLTLRWSGLKCWGCLSVYSYGTLRGRRGSSVLPPHTTGELRAVA
ncbi:ras-related protein Rab-34-like [Oncorhynchus keta]|uniref:ras-related protein Rab-34-like n=1 Tax=Oncorhynchus keta TaxID=8018 RepID=UPI00227C04D9|nr:ras-related protein Rab-34-like [Oncorhynchus keta]